MSDASITGSFDVSSVGSEEKPVSTSGSLRGRKVKTNPETPGAKDAHDVGLASLKSSQEGGPAGEGRLQGTELGHSEHIRPDGLEAQPSNDSLQVSSGPAGGGRLQGAEVQPGGPADVQVVDEKDEGLIADLNVSLTSKKEVLIPTLIEAPEIHFVSSEFDTLSDVEKEGIQDIFNEAIKAAKSRKTGKSDMGVAAATTAGNVDQVGITIKYLMPTFPSSHKFVIITRESEVEIAIEREEVGRGVYKTAMKISTIISNTFEEIFEENEENVLLLSDPSLSDEEKDAWETECQFSQKLKDAGVPHTVSFQIDEKALKVFDIAFAISRFKKGGTLYDRYLKKSGIKNDIGILKSDSAKYIENDFNVIAENSMETLSAMHEKGFYHNDVKPEQFLLNKKRTDQPLQKDDISLGDFGCSTDRTIKVTISHDRGTPYYMAPEVIKLKWDHDSPLQLNGKEDSFSLGMMLLLLPDCPGDKILDKQLTILKQCNQKLASCYTKDLIGEYEKFLAVKSANLIDNGSPREQLIGHLIDPNRDTRWDMKTASKFLQEKVLPPKIVITPPPH